MSLSSLYLDAFYACAQAGHFTKAAEELHITQSALSQRIAKLEDELGVTLIVRKSKGMELTSAGIQLLQYCKAKMELESETIERVRGSNSGEFSGVLRIGGFSSVMRSVILPSLGPMIAAHPSVRLHVYSKELDELPQLLRRGEIDYMIHYQELIRDEYETELLGVEKNVLAEKPGYSGAEVFLDHDENDQTSSVYLKKYMPKNKHYERRYLDDVYGLIDGVALGLGKAVLPMHLLRVRRDIQVIKPSRQIEFPLYLHYFRQPFYSRLHEEVVRLLRSNCKKFL